MAGGLGDILGATFVMMPRVFGVVPEPEPEPTGTVPTLVGVPSLKPRRRPGVIEAEGYGIQPVIGAGALTAEAAISGELEQAIEITGRLDAETALAAALVIRSGAEAILAREWGINAMMLGPPRGIARLATDAVVSGVGAATVMLTGKMAVDQPLSGRLSVRSGAEAVLTRMQAKRQVQLIAALVAMLRSR